MGEGGDGEIGGGFWLVFGEVSAATDGGLLIAWYQYVLDLNNTPHQQVMF